VARPSWRHPLRSLDSSRRGFVLIQRSLWRHAIWALAVAVVAWRAITLGLASHWASIDPEWALTFRSEQPVALREVAKQRLNEGRDAEAVGFARRALSADPLDGEPYRVLAEVEIRRGDRDGARRWMTLALEHSPEDAQARVWLAEDALGRHDIPRALALYDRYLQVAPEDTEAVFGVLMGLLSDPSGREPLVEALAKNPSWRTPFLTWAARSSKDPAVVGILFESLRSRGPLARDESAAAVDRWVRDRRWSEARAAWQDTLPVAERDNSRVPVNGDFEAAPSVPPFDWDITQTDGAEASIRALPEGVGHALVVQFLGRRTAFHHVRQLLLLKPARYVLSWRYRVDHLVTPRGLRWVVTCSEAVDQPVAGSMPVRGETLWTQATLAFEVPSGCDAQWLSLELDARIPAETQAFGSAWFDDVKIVRASDGARSASDADFDSNSLGRHTH